MTVLLHGTSILVEVPDDTLCVLKTRISKWDQIRDQSCLIGYASDTGLGPHEHRLYYHSLLPGSPCFSSHHIPVRVVQAQGKEVLFRTQDLADPHQFATTFPQDQVFYTWKLGRVL